MRVFTQNIDSLERKAGVPAERVVAAHGNFDGAACIECGGALEASGPRRISAWRARLLALVTWCTVAVSV